MVVHDTYKELEQLIPYINGFLLPLEILGSYTDHGKTYYVKEIERLQTYEKSVMKHLDEKYRITIEKITDWKSQIVETAKDFFKSAETLDKSIAKIANFDFLMELYASLMSGLITEKAEVFEVFVDWQHGAFYECCHKDYLIDNDKGLFFIHFGISD